MLHFRPVLLHSPPVAPSMHTQMPSLPASVKPISALDVCRLANKSKALGGGRPSLAPQGPGGLAIHEDTEFIRPLTAMDTGMASGAGAGMSMNMGGNGRSSSRGRRSSVGLPGLGGFAIHEDTDFIGIQPPPHGAPGARQGLGMGMGHQPLDSMANNNDDTVCVGLGLSQGQMGIAGGHMQQAPSAGLGLYEDTEFITGETMAYWVGLLYCCMPLARFPHDVNIRAPRHLLFSMKPIAPCPL